MDASIIVCTYNRADSLSETLEALRAQIVPPDIEWEVIVVDNNSSDHTAGTLKEMGLRWSRLRYEFETQQGLSYARNHGIAVSSGEVVVFTDDDVLPETDWLVTVLDGLNKYRADACGGYIAPIWESEPPKWLTARFYGFLAVRTDREDDFQITQAADAPYGANMAIRRSVLDKVGGFDTGRGRKGNVLASGEDGEMFERILSAGFKVFFLGQSRVHHKVEAFRLKKSYLRRWRFQTSKNLAISKGIDGQRRLLNIPLFLFPQLIRSFARMLSGYISKPPDEAFHREILVFHFLGLMRGLYLSR